MCELFRHHGLLSGQWQNLPKIQGLLNFTWVSEQQIEFVTPCIRSKEFGYFTVMVELADGRQSATKRDVEDGIIARDNQAMAEILIGEKCIQPGLFPRRGRL
jgi:hypothetical protein